MKLNCSKETLLTGLCSIFLLGYSPALYAGGTTAPLEVQQSKKITGTVSDAMGPVIGASVVIKGTSNGVATDFDGKYTTNHSTIQIFYQKSTQCRILLLHLHPINKDTTRNAQIQTYPRESVLCVTPSLRRNENNLQSYWRKLWSNCQL